MAQLLDANVYIFRVEPVVLETIQDVRMVHRVLEGVHASRTKHPSFCLLDSRPRYHRILCQHCECNRARDFLATLPQ